MNELFEGVNVQLGELMQEAEQRNAESQPAQPNDNSPQAESGADAATQQTIPYARFQEVIEERNRLREYMDRVTQQLPQAQAPQAPQTQAPPPQSVRDVLTPDEIAAFQMDALTDPGNALQRFGAILLERGVDRRVQDVEGRLRGEMQAYAQQFSQTMAPTLLDSYRQKSFSTPQMRAVQPIFDQLVQQAQQANAQIVYDQPSLDNLRALAIGRAFEQGQLGNGNAPVGNPTARLFSENPSATGFGGGNRNPQILSQVAGFAARLGLPADEVKKAEGLYQAMEDRGIFRQG